MARKHADILSAKRLKQLLEAVVSTNPQPTVMKTAFMLSFYAGLRVQEIAGLDWRINVMTSDGNFKTTDFPVYDGTGEVIRDANNDVITEPVQCLHIGSDIGKYGKERSIPLHDSLKEALQVLFDEQRGDASFPPLPHVIPSARPGASQALAGRAQALRMRINRTYTALGLDGCTSHSGRRSFVTRGATRANTVGQSLRDIQVLAGHRNLVTTQAYIQPSDQHKKLINAIWE